MASATAAWRAIQLAASRSAAHPAVRNFQRLGFVARGAVYSIVAALALAVALGLGGKTTDTRGALATLAATQAGRSLLVVLGIALAGLAVFFVVEALAPARRPSSRTWAVLTRLGNLVAAFGYATLAVAAERLGRGERAGPSGNRLAETWTARALHLPGGRWLVLVAAAVIVFVGARQAWRGVRRTFLEDLDVARLEGPMRRWAAPLGTAGFSVQGSVLVLVGLFLAGAAIRNNPWTATGFDGALTAILAQRWGTALLGLVALGLFAYAAYSVVEGRHRRLKA